MPSKRKFHKTVITLEVLSERPIGEMGIEDIAYEVTRGNFSGQWKPTETVELDGPQAAAELQAQGSDPDFFGLTANGEDADDHLNEASPEA